MAGLLDREKLVNNALDRLDRLERRMAKAEEIITVRVFNPVIGEEGALGNRFHTTAWLSLGWPPANTEKFHVYDGNLKVEGNGFEDVTGGTIYLQNKPSLKGASPADNDVAGLIRALGINDAGNPIIIADMYFQITDVTEGSEDGAVRIVTQKDYVDAFVFNLVRDRLGINELDPQRTLHIVGGDGAVSSFPSSLATADHLVLEDNGNCNIAIISSSTGFGGLKFYKSGTAGYQGLLQYNHSTDAMVFQTAATARVTIGPGVQVGSPTGGDKGAGTLNATAVYDDNVLLTDYLLDLYYDGKMRPEDKKKHPEAHIWTIPETAAFTKENRHLPTMPGRDEWEASGSKSVGELVTALWATVEQQQLQIFDLQNQIDDLKAGK